MLDAKEGEGITLETITKKKQGKKKTQIIEQQSFSFEQIDKTKLLYPFKIHYKDECDKFN